MLSSFVAICAVVAAIRMYLYVLDQFLNFHYDFALGCHSFTRTTSFLTYPAVYI